MGLASFYDQHILPRAIKCACSMEQIQDVRAEVVPLARGRVFELGCGGGINQKFYRSGEITGFAGIDPSPKLLDYAREQARENALSATADIREGFGENIPFDDDSFDSVVTTFTLCSVDDHGKTLSELRRILKPDGLLIFAEHGSAKDAGVRKWQRGIEPVWKRLMGNCHLTRPIADAIERAGFRVERANRRYMPRVPRFMGWVESGSAVKSG